MVYRHSLITRVTHAVYFLTFLALAVTGTQIFFHAHWLSLPIKTGRLHEYLGLVMIACGGLYLFSGTRSGELTKLLFGPRDAAGLLPMTAYYARLRPEPPSHDGYNPLQKLAYTIVLLTMGPLIAATGVAMWTKTGGRAMSIFHIGFAVELVLFFAGHIFMVATTGLSKNLRAIVTGWYVPQPQSRSGAIREKARTTVESPQSSPSRRALPTPVSR